MERLDQGHLHPLLEQSKKDMSRHRSRWEVSTLAKSYSNSVLIAIRNTRDMTPPLQCMLFHEHTDELHKDLGQIALASRSTLNNDIRHLQVRVFTFKQDRSRRGHHYGET